MCGGRRTLSSRLGVGSGLEPVRGEGAEGRGNIPESVWQTGASSWAGDPGRRDVFRGGTGIGPDRLDRKGGSSFHLSCQE